GSADAASHRLQTLLRMLSAPASMSLSDLRAILPVLSRRPSTITRNLAAPNATFHPGACCSILMSKLPRRSVPMSKLPCRRIPMSAFLPRFPSLHTVALSLALLAGLVGASALARPASAHAPKARAAAAYLTGIGDEQAEMFSDPMWQQLRTKIARY